MAEIGGQIVWNLDVDDNKFKSGLSSAGRAAEKFGADVDKTGQSLSSKLQEHLSGLAGFALVWAKRMAVAGGVAAAGFTVFGLKTAGDLESARQGFITLLGSAQEADKILAQIKKDAARTPFELKGLIQANQMLTSVTHNGQESERLLLNVGKALAAMGKGQPELDRIIVNLQQIGAVGHASTLDLRQFAFAGIPIYKLLNDQLGISGQRLEDMTANGEITFELLTQLFQKAGEGSGAFSQAFKNQAGTFNQLLSNMKDSLTIFASDFVKQIGLFDIAKQGIAGFTSAVTNNRAAIVSAVNTGINAFINAIVSLVTLLNNLFGPSLSALFNTITTQLLPSLKQLFDALQPALVEVLKIVAALIGAALVGALFIAINALNIIIHTISFVISSVAQLSQWIGNLIGVIVNLGGTITRTASNFGGLLYHAGRDLIQGLINGIKDMAGAAVDAVKGVVTGAVDKAKNLLKIHSPSEVFAKMGRNVGLGLVKGIEATRSSVRDSVSNLVGGLDVDSNFSLTPSLSGINTTGLSSANVGGASVVQNNNIYNQVDLDQVTRDLAWRLQQR